MSERGGGVARPTGRPSGARPRLAVGVLALVAIVGLGALVQPFTWDQAVFALGAERLLAGGTLYVDYWDFKQPGIFWFFAVGGRAFGTHELGIHLLELLWMLALAVVLQRSTRPWLGATASACAPLCVCGFYYAVAGSWHLLQVEGLVGLPLALSWTAGMRAGRGGRHEGASWFAAGLAGGFVLLFKLALAPVLLAAWAVPAWDRMRRESGARERRAAALRVALALGFGTLLPLGAALALFARQGALDAVWWTWVVFPSQIMSRLQGLPVANLASTGHWLLTAWPLLLVPAAVGAWEVLRRRDDGCGRSLIGWSAAGTLVFLAQRWSGWQYQVFLVLIPLGLLATRGLESLATRVARRWPGRTSTAASLAVLTLAAGFAYAGAFQRSFEVVRSGALTDPAARRELLVERSAGAYRHFARVTEFLRAPGAAPGPIFVLGNPLAYWVSGRAPAIAMPGGMSIYTAAEWQRIARELAAASPPYILLEDPMAEALAERSEIAAPLLELLSRRYRPAARFGTAHWLVRAAAP